MKKFLVVLCFFASWTCVKGLSCWTCNNAKDNGECINEGKLTQCQLNENACHNEVRRGDRGMLITKRCKQDLACTNNEIQNPRHSWQPSQCNSRVPSSVCRCCCATDNCNEFNLDCSDSLNEPPTCSPIFAPRFGRKRCQFALRDTEIGSICTFSCQQGYDLVGAESSRCELESNGFLARFSNSAPRCVLRLPDCSLQRAPAHGSVNCTETTQRGRSCSFECDDGHVLLGLDVIECDRNGIWDSIPPACVAVVCMDIIPPENGLMSCSFGFDEDSECTFSCIEGYRVRGAMSTVCQHILTDGVWTHPVPECERKRCSVPPEAPSNGFRSCSDSNILNSTCEYICDSGYRRIGAQFSTCTEGENNILNWDNDAPFCEEIVCKDQGNLRNGRINCTNGNAFDSICSFECTTEDFALSPAEFTSNTCTNDSSWSSEKPCCTRVCPPHSIIDLVLILDSSSSIGRRNWRTMKSFVSSIINTFSIGEDSARIGVFRYNRNVDTASQILLKDFPEDKDGLLKRFNAMPYDGSGTFTGNALDHARRVTFSPENGNRLDVPDYALIITDGKSRDAVKRPARRLHRNDVHVVAIGVVPLNGKLDFEQLNDIVNHPDDLIIAEAGFDDLNLNVFQGLIRSICIPGCF